MIEFNTSVLRIFVLGMYTMLCLTQGVRFASKVRGSVTQEARNVYLLAAICLFLCVTQCLLSVTVRDVTSLNFSLQTWVYIEHLITLSDYIIIPFCGLLLIQLTHTYEITLKRALVHTVPFILLFFFYFFSRDETGFKFAYTVSMAYAACIYLLTLTRVYIYQKALRSTYSNTSNRSLSWLYVFLNLLLIQNIIYGLTSATNVSPLPRTIYYLLSIANWWILASMLNRQVLDVDEMKEKLQERRRRLLILPANESEPQEEVPVQEESKSLIDREMQRLCGEERIYLNPELTCGDLAKAVGTNRTYMSLWFREHGTTFNDYINTLRLRYADHLMRTTDDNILTIASKSGFNHPNSFRNVFKEYFGSTPKEYRKQLKEKAEQ